MIRYRVARCQECNDAVGVVLKEAHGPDEVFECEPCATVRLFLPFDPNAAEPGKELAHLDLLSIKNPRRPEAPTARGND